MVSALPCLLADAPDGWFSGEPWNVVRWISGLGILVTLLGAGFLVRFLASRSRWRASRHGRWALLGGLLVLPSVSLVLGNAVGYHHATSTSCFQCHVMEPWVADLRDPQSPNLAARHWRNRWINSQPCYTCHKGYGVAGQLESKVKGLRHVWLAHVTGPPAHIEHDGPYPLQLCLECHAPTPKFQQNRGHRISDELWEGIRTGTLSCFACHAPPHPRPGKPPWAGPYPEAMCLRCHGPTPAFRESPSHVDEMVREPILSGELSCLTCHDAEHPRTPREPAPR